MCIIIIKKEGKKLSTEVAKTSSRMNPHGLGIMWLDTFEVTYHKSKEYKVLLTDRPFIAHFRYATIGKIGIENTHPFQCGSNKSEWLMMNGTIPMLGNAEESDTKVLANSIGDVPRRKWSNELEKYPCRFVTINTRNRSYQIYNKHLWTQHDGVWYSKDNVFEPNLVAVYGTLKRGNGNYNRFLSDSKFIGNGETFDKYPLIIKGLPYLIDKKGVGEWVSVDVFKVSNEVMADLDALEGHPNWYTRKRIPILIDGKVKNCWVYFNGTEIPSGERLHKSYNQSVGFKGSWVSAYQQEARSAASHTYTDELMYEHEQLKSRMEQEAMCVNCYHTLKHDGFMDYHCGSCDEWFCESEVLKY
jgi:gamma-glutamylaminecyclotransferase